MATFPFQNLCCCSWSASVDTQSKQMVLLLRTRSALWFGISKMRTLSKQPNSMFWNSLSKATCYFMRRYGKMQAQEVLRVLEEVLAGHRTDVVSYDYNRFIIFKFWCQRKYVPTCFPIFFTQHFGSQDSWNQQRADS